MLDSSIRVLVVDDVASMRNILSLMLNRIGFEAIEKAEDAEKAIQKLEQKEFGLVVSDWQMEGMTGLELLNKIRQKPVLQHIPIIFVTAHASDQNSAAAKSAGAQGYLIKPFRLDILQSTVKAAFDWREALELQATGRIIYKGCTLMPQTDQAGFGCHIFKDASELTKLPPQVSKQVAIDEAKLWIDQIGTNK